MGKNRDIIWETKGDFLGILYNKKWNRLWKNHKNKGKRKVGP